MATDNSIEKVLEQEIRREKYRKEYNERPDVKAARQKYNRMRQEQAKIARKLLKSEITHEEAVTMMNKLSSGKKPAVERTNHTSNA